MIIYCVILTVWVCWKKQNSGHNKKIGGGQGSGEDSDLSELDKI